MKRATSQKPVPASRYQRLRAGVSLEAAAKRAKISPAWLRQLEAGQVRFPFKKNLKFPLLTAERLSALYGCQCDAFLPGRAVSPAETEGAFGVPASVSCGVKPSLSVAAQGEKPRLRTRENSRAGQRYTRPRVPTLVLVPGGE